MTCQAYENGSRCYEDAVGCLHDHEGHTRTQADSSASDTRP